MTQSNSSKKRRRLSVRWKLVLPFILIVLLVVTIFFPLTNQVVSNRIEEEADLRLGETANSVAVLIEQSEQQAQLSASFVARLPEIKDANNNQDLLAAAIIARKAELDLQELSYYPPDFQPNGKPSVYGGPPVSTQLQVSETTTAIREQLVLDAIRTGEPASAIAIAPQSSQIIGVAPVLNVNEVRGVVLAVYFLNDSYMQQIQEVISADVALIRSNALIASTFGDREGEYAAILKDDDQRFARDLSLGDTDSQNIELDNSQRQRLFAEPLILNGQEQGVILVAQPIQSLFDIRSDIQMIIGVFSILVVVVSVVFGVMSYFNFARPLTILAQATNEVSSGNLSNEVHVHVPTFMFRDEISDLSENFNTMTTRLNDLYTGLERRVNERTHALNEAMQDLAIARDEALEANRTKSAFMANMSHELRTPLNAIIGYTNLLLAGTYGDVNEKQIDRLQRVMDNGHHLLNLINDVLDLSKIEAGKMEVYLETYDLYGLLDNVVQTARPLALNNRNEIVNNFSVELGTMHSDVTKVRQVLFNLLSNATKFTENGKITLSANSEMRKDKEGIRFDVVDTGIGMTPDQLSKIFKEFTQADASTTRKYGGTGLGLTISSKFCEMLGGAMTVTSEVGVGSTFTVWLPRETESPKRSTNEIKKVTGTHNAVNAKNIVLVIDDDEASVETIKHYLETDNFYVITCNNGEDGLRLAKEYKPTIITLDVLMPGMDGWAVLNELKKDEELADIPVIMTTIIGDRNMGYALGAADYVTKPIDKDQILRTINKYRCSMDPCPILLIEDDDSTRQMMRDMLESNGWQVNEAINGQRGIEALENLTPELILLDLMMPQMNGFEFLRRIRQNEKWRAIPVVVITAMELSPEAQHELMSSVQNIIQKGEYQPEDLLREIRHWVGTTVASE